MGGVIFFSLERRWYGPTRCFIPIVETIREAIPGSLKELETRIYQDYDASLQFIDLQDLSDREFMYFYHLSTKAVSALDRKSVV